MVETQMMNRGPRASEKVARPTGESIRTLRKFAGLTLRELARCADTSIAYLSGVETGKFIPTRGYVAQITAAIAESMAAAV